MSNQTSVAGRAEAPGLTARQQRLLGVFRVLPNVTRAARLAGINPCTVHRWQKQPRFFQEMQRAKDEHQAAMDKLEEAAATVGLEQMMAANDARQEAREQRERERNPHRNDPLAQRTITR